MKLFTRRNYELRLKKFNLVIHQYIQNYIKNGSKGELDLMFQPLTKLPNNLKKVGGHLGLCKSKIKYLPDNLTVKRTLDIYDTPIDKLPENLTVYGNLDIQLTKINTLPTNLIVTGVIYIFGSPLSENINSIRNIYQHYNFHFSHEIIT